MATTNNPMCKCGNQSIPKFVQKEGPNKGREFYTCATRDCDFFQWVDQPEEDTRAKAQKRGYTESTKPQIPKELSLLLTTSIEKLVELQLQAEKNTKKLETLLSVMEDKPPPNQGQTHQAPKPKQFWGPRPLGEPEPPRKKPRTEEKEKF